MWKEGCIKVGTTLIHYWVKSYEEPSEEYGIEGGRISKLSLKCGDKWLANYDRGWDIRPETPDAFTALAILMTDYN